MDLRDERHDAWSGRSSKPWPHATRPNTTAIRRRSLDEAYSAALHDVWEAYPRDYEVGTLYGESLMLLQPRRGLWDINNPEVQHIHRVLEGVYSP